MFSDLALGLMGDPEPRCAFFLDLLRFHRFGSIVSLVLIREISSG